MYKMKINFIKKDEKYLRETMLHKKQKYKILTDLRLIKVNNLISLIKGETEY